MAELFTRKGFHVDLYRSSKDDGIAFLRVDIEKPDPVIFCVQCKHPDMAGEGKKRRTLPVATVREIYGVAKAHDLQGCIAVTSSSYTPDAKKFADLKPEEILCWFSLIWKNRLVGLASKGSGLALRSNSLYRSPVAELRFPLPCAARRPAGSAAGCADGRTGRWRRRRWAGAGPEPTGPGRCPSGRT